ncbi:MAG: hypothetical protein KTR16_11495 [Acidiferrobacterales bacterium]|nr:hypothetical protein [Acidiferrobacterales bacterium]
MLEKWYVNNGQNVDVSLIEKAVTKDGNPVSKIETPLAMEMLEEMPILIRCLAIYTLCEPVESKRGGK